MVPARSTTANTMTAQSSLLTDMVMLANAGSWCMNSSNCSVRGKEERQRRKRRRFRKKKSKHPATWHPEERTRTRQRCSWQACSALASANKARAAGWASERIIATVKGQQRNHYQEDIKPNINSIDINGQGEPRIIADTSLNDLSVRERIQSQTLNLKLYFLLRQVWSS